MFERPWHREVQAVLQVLDADLFKTNGLLFAGGTRIVLDLGEYRESHDIDFLTSQAAGYAELRFLVRQRGPGAFFTPAGRAAVTLPREPRIDQYGIRFPVERGGRTIKVELIREGRVELLLPGAQPPWSPVPCLTASDCFAEKLLACSDRWPDRQTLSRDLLDLAAMRAHWGAIPEPSWNKAEAAYKKAIRVDLEKAIAAFRQDPEHQKRCFTGLGIQDPAPLLAAMDNLAEEI